MHSNSCKILVWLHELARVVESSIMLVEINFAHRLGLLSDELVDLAGSPLDALCSHLQKKLQYRPGERDAIYLHHFIGIEWPDKKVSGVHKKFSSK